MTIETEQLGTLTVRHHGGNLTEFPEANVLNWQIGEDWHEKLQYKCSQMNGGGFEGTVTRFHLLAHGSTRELALTMLLKKGLLK